MLQLLVFYDVLYKYESYILFNCMYLFLLHVHNHFVMIYTTTAYNSKTDHHYANNPKNV